MNAYTIKEKIKGAYPTLKEKYGYKNLMQAPKVLKVIVATGTGTKSRSDKKRGEFIAGRLATITGQKASPRAAKQSLASFKLREGEIIGYMVTLRGERMYGFLEKLLNIAVPRTKDFRGFSKRSIDGMGNFTIGIKEHTIFPETADEDLKDVFGLAVTIVTNVADRTEAGDFLDAIGVPFRELAVDKKKRAVTGTPGKKRKK
jgi:large subunit ribosomal protein L5